MERKAPSQSARGRWVAGAVPCRSSEWAAASASQLPQAPCRLSLGEPGLAALDFLARRGADGADHLLALPGLAPQWQRGCEESGETDLGSPAVCVLLFFPLSLEGEGHGDHGLG